MADLERAVLAHLRDSGETLRRAESQAPVIAAMAARLTAVFRAGGKLLVFGNGGSAADSQHFAAELMARFRRNRAPLPALALTVNTSDLTAISNDFGYDAVFERPVRALARPGDAVVAISTSGNSANVLKAAAAAQELGAAVLGFTGEEGGKLAPLYVHCLSAPSKTVARIQEVHIAAIHILCDLVEEALFPDAPKAH